MDGCLIEGVNLTLELFSIHGCRGQLLEQCPKHGLALLGGHGTVGVLEGLDQHRRLLVLEPGKETCVIHPVPPLTLPGVTALRGWSSAGPSAHCRRQWPPLWVAQSRPQVVCRGSLPYRGGCVR